VTSLALSSCTNGNWAVTRRATELGESLHAARFSSIIASVLARRSRSPLKAPVFASLSPVFVTCEAIVSKFLMQSLPHVHSMVVFWFGYCDGIHDCSSSQNITVQLSSKPRNQQASLYSGCLGLSRPFGDNNVHLPGCAAAAPSSTHALQPQLRGERASVAGLCGHDLGNFTTSAATFIRATSFNGIEAGAFLRRSGRIRRSC
jgi:hypothetical protein